MLFAPLVDKDTVRTGEGANQFAPNQIHVEAIIKEAKNQATGRTMHI
jgi:hypothetical protein